MPGACGGGGGGRAEGGGCGEGGVDGGEGGGEGEEVGGEGEEELDAEEGEGVVAGLFHDVAGLESCRDVAGQGLQAVDLGGEGVGAGGFPHC